VVKILVTASFILDALVSVGVVLYLYVARDTL
jgi:hypothetical protein